MTEKKPGEPDERDYAVGREILYGPATRQNARSVGKVIAAYREEIESRAVEAERERRVKDTEAFVREGIKDALEKARREGAREALEIAGKEIGSVLIRLINSNFSPEDLRRALADQPEAEGKENPLYACNKCGYCGPLEIHPRYLGTDNCNYRAFLIPPQPPAKADALPSWA